MTTIGFCLITDTDYQTVEQLMAEFKQETGVDVRLKSMEAGNANAWAQLIGIATQGQGADISHVDSTGVSSLMTVNALWPIPSPLTDTIGGDQAFVPSTWSSGVAENDRNVYGIPLGTELGSGVQQLKKDHSLDLDSMVDGAMDSLAYRSNLTLG